MAVDGFLKSLWQRLFLGIVVLQAGVVLGMIGAAYGLVSNDALIDTGSSSFKTLPCYLALFGLAELFELYIAIDALRLRNSLQLIAMLEFHTALVVLSALQVHQTRTAICSGPDWPTLCVSDDSLWSRVKKLLIVVPVILGVSLIGLCFAVRALYAEFGWAIFHAIGADPRMRTMYRWYQIMICLLKFDFFCFAGVTMQLLILVLQRDQTEFALTILAIPIVLLLLAMCGFAVTREVKPLMLASLVLMAAAETYFVYKFVKLFLPRSKEEYVSTRTALAFFLIVAFLILLCTFFCGIVCFKDFDQGLRQPKVQEGASKSKYNATNGTPMVEQGYAGGAPLGPRMSIE